MNIELLKKRALDLEQEVKLAKKNGYSNADSILTPEVKKIFRLIYSGKLNKPVELKYTAGPRWNFSETSLGDCKKLESAWASFCIDVQGRREALDKIKKKWVGYNLGKHLTHMSRSLVNKQKSLFSVTSVSKYQLISSIIYFVCLMSCEVNC